MSLRQQLLEFFDQEIIHHYSTDEFLRHLIEFLPIFFNFDCASLVLENKNNDFTHFQGYNCPEEYENSLLLDKHELVLKSYAQVDLIVSTNNQRAFFHDTNKYIYCEVVLFPLVKGENVVGFIILENKLNKPDIISSFETVYGYIASRVSAFLENVDISTTIEGFVEEKVQNFNEEDFCLSGNSLANQSIIGLAFLDNKNFLWEKIKKSYIEDIQIELEKFKVALAEAIKQTIEIEKQAAEKFIEANSSIFFAQLMFLQDDQFVQSIENNILEKKYNASYAIKRVCQRYITRFNRTNDSTLRARSLDIKDIGLRLIELLTYIHHKRQVIVDRQIVLVTDNIMPSDFIKLPLDNILGIICSRGSVVSHSAILAKSLGIPAIFSVENILKSCSDNSLVVIDAKNTQVICNPSEQTQRKFLQLQKNRLRRKHELVEPSISKDGEEINVYVNISVTSDLGHIVHDNYSGVGLYRSEFMFMMADDFPKESEQLRVYSYLANSFASKPVTIRILDIGGDKGLNYFPISEENPMLGWRSIRILFERYDILRNQVRALIKAHQQNKNIRILVPMVTEYSEGLAIKEKIKEIFQELLEENSNIECPLIGMMVENGSCLWQLDDLVPIFDFVSIGSNDLVQYVFSVDRNNQRVAHYYQTYHPTIIKIVEKISKSCQKYDKELSICGELAGDDKFLPIILACGVRNISISVGSLEKVIDKIRATDIQEAKKLLEKVKVLKTQEEVKSLL